MKLTLKSLLHYIIIGILLFAIYGSLELSMNDFQVKNVCPKLLGIPACYIVLAFFIIGLLNHIFLKSTSGAIIFFISIGLVFMMALNGTITELSGVEVCPRTSGGTPMCYISLGICSTLLILRTIELFVRKRSTH